MWILLRGRSGAGPDFHDLSPYITVICEQKYSSDAILAQESACRKAKCEGQTLVKQSAVNIYTSIQQAYPCQYRQRAYGEEAPSVPHPPSSCCIRRSASSVFGIAHPDQLTRQSTYRENPLTLLNFPRICIAPRNQRETR